jgi:hypothetical protein
MFKSDSIKQGLVAALAAIVFTATTVTAAVGPARVAETTPIQVAAASIDGGARA